MCILKDVAKKHKINFFMETRISIARFCTLIIKKKLINILRITSDNYLIQPMLLGVCKNLF